MPRYEYACDKCGYEFEIQAKVDDPPPKCPREILWQDAPLVVIAEDPEAGVLVGRSTRCGGPTHKLISRSTFMLKGGGWAADGYSSGGK